jgi:hypothetical protein
VVYTPLQLNAGCPPGQSQPFFILNPDGTSGPQFTIPVGASFALTDVSIVPANMTSAVPTLIMAGLRQVSGTGHTQRWNFAGYTAQNVDRSFITPVMFSKDFEVWNVSASVILSVNLFGYVSV